jgi:hypothetical protein
MKDITPDKRLVAFCAKYGMPLVWKVPNREPRDGPYASVIEDIRITIKTSDKHMWPSCVCHELGHNDYYKLVGWVDYANTEENICEHIAWEFGVKYAIKLGEVTNYMMYWRSNQIYQQESNKA